MFEGIEQAKKTMLLLLEAVEKETGREPIVSDRVSALANTISALTPLIQSNW